MMRAHRQQQDDWDRHTEEKQQKRTHTGLLTQVVAVGGTVVVRPSAENILTKVLLSR
jgi:hypothetical protein